MKKIWISGLVPADDAGIYDGIRLAVSDTEEEAYRDLADWLTTSLDADDEGAEILRQSGNGHELTGQHCDECSERIEANDDVVENAATHEVYHAGCFPEPLDAETATVEQIKQALDEADEIRYWNVESREV